MSEATMNSRPKTFWERRCDQLMAEACRAELGGDWEAAMRVLAAFGRVNRARMAAGKLDYRRAAGAR